MGRMEASLFFPLDRVMIPKSPGALPFRSVPIESCSRPLATDSQRSLRCCGENWHGEPLLLIGNQVSVLGAESCSRDGPCYAEDFS